MNHPKGVVGSLKYNKRFEKYISKNFENRITYLGIQLKDSSYNHYLNINRGLKFQLFIMCHKDYLEA